jgi:dethiobiotin synthetase
MASILFITGTDTGVGKTELAILLARYLRGRGSFRVVKPFSSGRRHDAIRLRKAQGEKRPVASLNPWHFMAPLAPLVAARMEGRRCDRQQVLSWLRAEASEVDLLVVEGAGGLMSPLAPRLDARWLITQLQATPVIVCPDRLGAINQALLVLEALPKRIRSRARLVLVEPKRRDASNATNLRLLSEFLGPGRILSLPRLTAQEKREGTDGRPPRHCLLLLKALLAAAGFR